MRHAWIPALLLLAGYLFTRTGFVGYGSALFVLFPLAAGYALASFGLTRRVSVLIVGALIALAGLLLIGAEGLVCVLMAIPIVLPLLLLGYWLQRRTQGAPAPREEDGPLDRPLALAAPLLLLLLGGTAEHFFAREPAPGSVTSTILLPHAPDEVFAHITNIDTMTAGEPLLLSLGLPRPYKAVLEADSVGARRTCFFPEGTIEMCVTRYEPGRRLAFDITAYRLPAGAWLAFDRALYTLDEQGGATLLTRTTTYHSFLRPRFYWAAVEQWTIGQEHRFVLESVANNLVRGW